MTVFSLQDYETDLASYTSGLETLLNIPIKRTMLRSPSMDLNQEVTALWQNPKQGNNVCHVVSDQ